MGFFCRFVKNRRKNSNFNIMTPEKFIQHLRKEVNTYTSFLETDSQDWIVKGFIDIDKNVYTITNDTKVVSKMQVI